MPKDSHYYFSYLLRIWEAHVDEEITWRASLERPGEKTRYGFSDLEAVFEFIRDDICKAPSDNNHKI